VRVLWKARRRSDRAQALVRPRTGRKIAGVCAGVAEYFDIDVTVVRVVWLIVALMPPTVGLCAYIVAWIVMPKEPEALTAPAGQQVTTT